MRVPVLLLLLGLLARPMGAQQGPDPSAQTLLVAEDSRGALDLPALLRGIESPDPVLAARAIRAVGRLEQPALLSRILGAVADPRPRVRFAAVHAVAQIGQDTAVTAGVLTVLVDRVSAETDPAVLGALARSIGRLPGLTADRVRAAEAALTTLAGKTLPPAQIVEVVRGVEAFGRGAGSRTARSPELAARLRRWVGYADADAATAARVRRAALASLMRSPADNQLLARLAGDPDEEVRRLAVLWAADTNGIASRRGYLAEALIDRSPAVRVEALRVWGRRFQADDCAPVIRSTQDRDPKVAIQALELLGLPCAPDPGVSDLLWPLVDSLVGTQRARFTTIASWHRGVTALVSLARIDPARARTVLTRIGAAPTWQIRMYAARAAAIVGDADRLITLAEDANDNVREAAVAGLITVRAHGTDSTYRMSLSRPDYQLIITAARALAGTPEPRKAASVLLAALERITMDRRDTSRDPRLAILERLAEVGTAEHAAALEPYLTDFDPVVAARAATLLTTWTGQPRQAAPQPLPLPPLDARAISRLDGARLRVTMSPVSGGGVFEVTLFAELAPATVSRLVARAAEGYYDGLTFHRVVSNFVIQGGSPGANEYAGDAQYMRDEIGPLSHERGTVGISTRGRDTGDAQVFVNLVDNLRLDFNYTVFGRVTAGMEVVDAILEGDVIDRIDLVDANGAAMQL